MKKTLGRRRIPMRKIENKSNRLVSFSKRRAGLFKKASELSTLCGSEIAIIVFSEAGNAFTHGHPSPDSVIQRYVNSPDSPLQNPIHPQSAGNGIRKFCSNEEANLWENHISMLGLDDLKSYASHLQKIWDTVTVKAASMASPSGYVADQKDDDVSDNGNKNSSSHDLLVHDNYSDDVNWGDIESYMANSPSISPDCSDEYIQSGEAASDVMPTSSSSGFELDTHSSYEYTQEGDGALDDGYLQSIVLSTSSSGFKVNTQSSYEYTQVGDGALDGGYLPTDVIPTSSSSSLELDTQYYSCLSDIQWQEEEDAWF